MHSDLIAKLEAPEGRQDNEPRAYIVHAPEDDYYGTGPDRLQFHPLAQHDMDNGYRQTPLYGRPAHELSGDPGELIDKMADAIRGDTVLDDTPWEMLSEDRKVGWRGDAERALAVVKEYLTSQAATALRLSAGSCKTERRKFYHHGYSTAELLKARKSPSEFFTDDGEAWRYEYTHSDGEGGAYDMLYRPASPTVEAGHVE